MELVMPWYLFDETAGDLELTVKERNKSAEPAQGKKIRCCSCEHVITHEGQRISIDGSHSHMRVNPGGYQYNFECFQEAPGCTVLGTATDDHTWFTGYQWRLAACTGCGEHLGWFFTGEGGFFGLIRERMYSEDS